MFILPRPNFQTDTKTEKHQPANAVISLPTATLYEEGSRPPFNGLKFFILQKQQGAGSVMTSVLCCSKDPLDEDLVIVWRSEKTHLRLQESSLK